MDLFWLYYAITGGISLMVIWHWCRELPHVSVHRWTCLVPIIGWISSLLAPIFCAADVVDLGNSTLYRIAFSGLYWVNFIFTWVINTPYKNYTTRGGVTLCGKITQAVTYLAIYYATMGLIGVVFIVYLGARGLITLDTLYGVAIAVGNVYSSILGGIALVYGMVHIPRHLFFDSSPRRAWAKEQEHVSKTYHKLLKGIQKLDMIQARLVTAVQRLGPDTPEGQAGVGALHQRDLLLHPPRLVESSKELLGSATEQVEKPSKRRRRVKQEQDDANAIRLRFSWREYAVGTPYDMLITWYLRWLRRVLARQGDLEEAVEHAHAALDYLEAQDFAELEQLRQVWPTHRPSPFKYTYCLKNSRSFYSLASGARRIIYDTISILWIALGLIYLEGEITIAFGYPKASVVYYAMNLRYYMSDWLAALWVYLIQLFPIICVQYSLSRVRAYSMQFPPHYTLEPGLFGRASQLPKLVLSMLWNFRILSVSDNLYTGFTQVIDYTTDIPIIGVSFTRWWPLSLFAIIIIIFLNASTNIQFLQGITSDDGPLLDDEKQREFLVRQLIEERCNDRRADVLETVVADRNPRPISQ